MEYFVTWEIEVTADNLADAADKALEIHRDPDSIATVFDVTGDDGKTYRVEALDGSYTEVKDAS